MVNLLNKTAKIIGGDRFFYFVLGLIVVQAVWFALSLQPWIFDEPKHIGRIQIYTEQILPFLHHQDLAWDKFGELVRNGSYMFYYLMSWPLRFFELFTPDKMIQVILLRFVNVIFVLCGVILYRKAFLEIGKIPKYIVNLVFLFLCTIPSFALLGGAVNYDNLVFLLFAAAIYIAIKIIKSSKISPQLLAAVIAISLFASVIKWTSMALFLPVILYVTYDQYKKHGKQFFMKLRREYKKLTMAIAIIIPIPLLIATGLFIERPVTNTILYGKPEPSCIQILSYERCMKFQDFAAYVETDSNKRSDFLPLDPISYGIRYWGPIMLKTETNTIEKGNSTSLPVATYGFAFASLVGIFLVLAYIRRIAGISTLAFMLIIATTYTVLLFIDEYFAYTKHGIPAAIRFRYLLPIIPILILFALLSARNYLKKFRFLLALSLLIFLVITTQGGGIITSIMTTPREYYWKDGRSYDINTNIRNAGSPFIVDSL